MIENLSPGEAYWEAKEKGYEEYLEDVILSKGMPRHAYSFAKDVPGSDIESLQEIVIEDPEWSYAFAKDIPNADINLLQDIAAQEPEVAYLFARDVKGADIDELFNVVEGTEWEDDFVKNVFHKKQKESVCSRSLEDLIVEQSEQKIKTAIDKAAANALNSLYKDLKFSISIDKAKKLKSVLAQHLGQALESFFK